MPEVAIRPAEDQATSQAAQKIVQEVSRQAATATAQEFASQVAPADKHFMESENGARFLFAVAMAKDERDLKRTVSQFVPPFKRDQQMRQLTLAQENHTKIQMRISSNAHRLLAERGVKHLLAEDRKGLENIYLASGGLGVNKDELTKTIGEKAPRHRELLLDVAAGAGVPAAVIIGLAQEWGVKPPEGMEIGARQAAEVAKAMLANMASLTGTEASDLQEYLEDYRNDGAAARTTASLAAEVEKGTRLGKAIEKAAEKAGISTDQLIEKSARMLAALCKQSAATTSQAITALNNAPARTRGVFTSIVTRI
ncbi:MAG TPA: hypothetical protein VJH24_01145 [Candidatus Bilamarchaeaceae archaeon]|nr:hypothetical protein [Candidatus Bilamarchaeaceae archaeon]